MPYSKAFPFSIALQYTKAMGYSVCFVLCWVLPRETEGGDDKDHEAFCGTVCWRPVTRGSFPGIPASVFDSLQKQPIKGRECL